MNKKKWTTVDTLYWLGSGLMALGVGLRSLPSGLVVAGAFCLLGGFLIDRAQGRGGGGR